MLCLLIYCLLQRLYILFQQERTPRCQMVETVVSHANSLDLVEMLSFNWSFLHFLTCIRLPPVSTELYKEIDWIADF